MCEQIDLNQPYATFNITKTADPQTTAQTSEAGRDDGLMPVAAAAKVSSSDSIDIVKMLVKKGSCFYSRWNCDHSLCTWNSWKKNLRNSELDDCSFIMAFTSSSLFP